MTTMLKYPPAMKQGYKIVDTPVDHIVVNDCGEASVWWGETILVEERVNEAARIALLFRS